MTKSKCAEKCKSMPMPKAMTMTKKPTASMSAIRKGMMESMKSSKAIQKAPYKKK